MTPLITDNYLGYRPRGVISTGPSPALAGRGMEEEDEEKRAVRGTVRLLKSIMERSWKEIRETTSTDRSFRCR